MLIEIRLSTALLGTGSASVTLNDEAREAIEDLYHHAIHGVQVDPAESRRRLAEIEARLDSPSGAAARALEQLAAEVRQDQPDGRGFRCSPASSTRPSRRSRADAAAAPRHLARLCGPLT